jgi:hypothetical protein
MARIVRDFEILAEPAVDRGEDDTGAFLLLIEFETKSSLKQK